MYIVLEEFAYTQVLKAPNAKMVELKVWEPPVNGASYVLSCDPAFGTSEIQCAVVLLRSAAVTRMVWIRWPSMHGR